MSRCTKLVDKGRHQVRRSDTELASKQLSVHVILPGGLTAITECQVGGDQRSVCAFPKGIRRSGREPHLDGLGEVPLLRERFAEALEPVQPELADPFPVEDDPIVHPCRQQILSYDEAMDVCLLRSMARHDETDQVDESLMLEHEPSDEPQRVALTLDDPSGRGPKTP
jgi:hypothetical protein